MKILLIGGTPGTGKSLVSESLGKNLNRQVVNLGQIAREKQCLKSHDDDRDTDIIDEDCLVDAIEDLIDEQTSDLIIEGHYIDLVPSRRVERVFILRCHPDVLVDRLRTRGYAQEKIAENVESEIFGVCQLDAIDAFGEAKVYEIDSSDSPPTKIVDEIQKLLKSSKAPTRLDWMIMLEEEGRLEDFL